MHSMNESESGSLMAQWRATGGAIQAHAFEAPSGDEGLAAVQYTTPMHPYAQCSGDDGLAAAEMTMPSVTHPCFGIDPGDDGLAAGSVTGMHIPGVCAGDDLTV
ncbi:MAG: hypothetical protein IH626_22585 [Rhodospirillales bacterium]|nr:hypothetical protein [Rhodospirillales bacterium]